MRKEIALKPLCEYGTAAALVCDDSVKLAVRGVNGCLKAWLTGQSGNLQIGNIVDGKLEKEADTAPYSGILITQSGRQMFYGTYSDDSQIVDEPQVVIEPPAKEEVIEEVAEAPLVEQAQKVEPPLPLDGGFLWRRITTSAYPCDSLSVRYILSHQSVYNSFLAHGGYYYGEKEGAAAVAMKCDIKNEPHPMPHMAQFTSYINGYFIVCVNLDTKEFYPYQ